ncbi:MAG: Smr/MutS family protein [Candidatus Eisenbacteria bacterium]|nr:Smr/MutS family protein [Candidatus Eisenbacteria bacterium]
MGFLDRLRGFLAGGERRAPRGRERAPDDEGDGEPSGEIVVTDVLDLHGFFPEQIPEVMEEFLAGAERLGIVEVRIIHGKGRSVLRREVWDFLKRDPRVVRFGQAPPERGGWGATLAMLRRAEREREETR